MQKKYVSVNADVDTDGIIRPLRVLWDDGRQWEIERILHTCRSPDFTFTGIRYTVLISGTEKYLYQEDTSWYVDAPT